MLKKLAVATALTLATTNAYAVLDNINNNYDNSTTTNNAGGLGGEGGKGGNAYAKGGSAYQGQGQEQSQIGINKNANSNKNISNNRNDNTANSNSVSGASSRVSTKQGVDNKIKIEGDNYEAPKIPVNSAYAPTVLPTSDCLSAASAGGSGQFWSFGFGFNHTASDCNRRADANQWSNMGYKEIAFSRMCQDKENMAAVEGAGYICPNSDIKKLARKNSNLIITGDKIAKICTYPSAECDRIKKYGYFN